MQPPSIVTHTRDSIYVSYDSYSKVITVLNLLGITS
jgi:hypothetical protein